MVIYYDRDFATLVSEINTFAELLLIFLLVVNFKYCR